MQRRDVDGGLLQEPVHDQCDPRQRHQGRHRDLPGQCLVPGQVRSRPDPSRRSPQGSAVDRGRGGGSRAADQDRHQDPSGSDLDYAARINHYGSVDDFVAAHSGSPWFVSMVGFVAGLPFMYQMVERQRQIEVPKYLRPRTDTPKLTIGHGGCFGCIYSVRGAGGYQMFGITPMPIYDPNQEISYLRDFMVFFRPGDIVKWKPIDRTAYNAISADVDAGKFAPLIRDVSFDLAEFNADIDGYNARLNGALHGN